MHIGRLGAVALIVLLTAACSSPTSSNPPGGECTHALDSDVTLPTNLSPTGADCDYLLSGTVEVRSALTIAPGTTIVAAPGSHMIIDDGGRITAEGTEAAPISFVGSEAMLGSWYGICFSGDHLESSLDFVEMYWAGAVLGATSPACRAGIGSILEGGGPVHITNSLVAGAYTTGIDATQFPLGEFRNNVLAGHREDAMRVSPSSMGRLDASTNYGGTGVAFEDGSSAENGRPFAALNPGTLDVADVGEELQYWVPLDVPYYVTRDDIAYSRSPLTFGEHTTTIIEAGTTLVMGPDTSIHLEREAVVLMAGAAGEPVRLVGESSTPGPWSGIWMAGGGLVADHVVVQGAGNPTEFITAAAISFWSAGGPSHCSHVRNTTIIGSAADGVWIDEEHTGLVRLDAMTFEDIAGANIVGQNTGPAILEGESCP